MRKRKIGFLLYLNEEEAERLNKLAKSTGNSKSKYLRLLINGYKPITAPAANYPVLIRELRAVGNNLNQLLKHARAVQYINTSELQKVLDDLIETERQVNLAFTVKKD